MVTVVTVAVCCGDSGDFNVMSTAQGHMRTRVMIVLVSGCGDSGFVVITVMGGSDGGDNSWWCNCCCNPRCLIMSHIQSTNKGSESALDTRHATQPKRSCFEKGAYPQNVHSFCIVLLKLAFSQPFVCSNFKDMNRLRVFVYM